MNQQIIQQVTASVIAIVVICGTVGLIIFQAATGGHYNVPDVLQLLTGAVAGAYLTHNATTNGARAAGIAAAQVAVMTATQTAQGAPGGPQAPAAGA